MLMEGHLSRLPVRVVEQEQPRSSSPGKGGVLTTCPTVSGYPRSIPSGFMGVGCRSCGSEVLHSFRYENVCSFSTQEGMQVIRA